MCLPDLAKSDRTPVICLWPTLPRKIYWYGMSSDALDESDGSGNITDEYVFFGGQRIARRNIATGNVFYYFSDHLGTSRAIVQDGQSATCYDADFYPFGGEAAVASNTCSQNYKFTGKERDAETGLDNFGARYNASGMGRFMSPDPLLNSGRPSNPQSWNRYSYVLNNPLNLVDPTGLYDLVNNCKPQDKKCYDEFKRNADRLKAALKDLEKKLAGVKDERQKARLEAADLPQFSAHEIIRCSALR